LGEFIIAGMGVDKEQRLVKSHEVVHPLSRY
jgi:hypothetical protein